MRRGFYLRRSLSVRAREAGTGNHSHRGYWCVTGIMEIFSGGMMPLGGMFQSGKVPATLKGIWATEVEAQR